MNNFSVGSPLCRPPPPWFILGHIDLRIFQVPETPRAPNFVFTEAVRRFLSLQVIDMSELLGLIFSQAGGSILAGLGCSPCPLRREGCEKN